MLGTSKLVKIHIIIGPKEELIYATLMNGDIVKLPTENLC